jgi:hypothetical protein
MALDTRDKRASALGVAVATLALVLPNPDGAALTQADRQHAAFCYSGIAAAVVVVGIGEIDLIGRYMATAALSATYTPSLTLTGQQE